jgi:hypothetical protein
MSAPPNPNPRVLVTEILDKARKKDVLRTVVNVLLVKNIRQVRVKFGFVVDRDLKGKPQGSDQTIPLSDLESFIESGLTDGTIEWRGGSDFHFYPAGTDLDFMLCNDADLHLTSSDTSLLMEIGHAISASGIKVYDSGRLI